MTLSDYRTFHPRESESTIEYCCRLEKDGYEEMLIRKALGYHFRTKPDDDGQFFEQFELARLRHLMMLKEIHPNRNAYSFKRKVIRNLSISEERADYWIKRFQEVGEVTYID